MTKARFYYERIKIQDYSIPGGIKEVVREQYRPWGTGWQYRTVRTREVYQGAKPIFDGIHISCGGWHRVYRFDVEKTQTNGFVKIDGPTPRVNDHTLRFA